MRNLTQFHIIEKNMFEGQMKREKIEEMRDFVDSRGKYWQDALNNSKRTSKSQLSPLVFEASAAGRVRNAIGEWEKYGSIIGSETLNSSDSKEIQRVMSPEISPKKKPMSPEISLNKIPLRTEISIDKIPPMSPEISLDNIDIKNTLDVAIKRGSKTYHDETLDVYYDDKDDITDEQKVDDLSAELSFTESDMTDAVEIIISPCLEESFKEEDNKDHSANVSFDIFDDNDTIEVVLSPLILPNRHSLLAQANNPVESNVSTFKIPSARLPKVKSNVCDIHISDPLMVDLFKIGATHYYKHFNKTSLEITMIQTQNFKNPIILSCHILPIVASRNPLQIHAVTKTFSSGEAFVVLTIGSPKGCEINSSYYGIKKLMISSPDDLWPFLELQVDILPPQLNEDFTQGF
jgi:hypothetical protein